VHVWSVEVSLVGKFLTQEIKLKSKSSEGLEISLLERLSKQHRDINKQQKLIERSDLNNAADIRAILALLSNFKQNFEAHVLLEQKEFYSHLEQLVADDSKKLIMLKDYRKELNADINRVLRYCNRYKTARQIRQGQDTFNEDSVKIRKLVKHRSRLEERELFPLYEALN